MSESRPSTAAADASSPWLLVALLVGLDVPRDHATSPEDVGGEP